MHVATFKETLSVGRDNEERQLWDTPGRGWGWSGIGVDNHFLPGGQVSNRDLEVEAEKKLHGALHHLYNPQERMG